MMDRLRRHRPRALPLVALALLGGCAALGAGRPRGAAPVQLAELGWLLGPWRVTEGEGAEATYEAVQDRDDGALDVVYFTDSTRTATHPDTGRIQERGGRLFFSRGRVRWVVAGDSATDLRLEPVSGTDVRLHWTRVTTTRRVTTLTRMDGQGRSVTRTLSLKRLEADHSLFLRNAEPPSHRPR